MVNGRQIAGPDEQSATLTTIANSLCACALSGQIVREHFTVCIKVRNLYVFQDSIYAINVVGSRDDYFVMKHTR